MVIWVIKMDWVQSWTRARNCSLRRTYVFGCIFVFIEVLWSWPIFAIVIKEFFSGWLFMHVQGFFGGTMIYCSIILYWKLSHTFVVKSISNTVLFQVWDWWGPGSLKWYVLVLLTSIYVLILLTSVSMLVLLTSVYVLMMLTGIFVGVLKLIWSILML